MTAPFALLFIGCFGLSPVGGTDTGVDGGTTDTGPSTSTFGGMTFPASVDFGQIVVGDDPVVSDVVLTNDSGANVKITQIALDAGADFQAEYTSVPWVIGSGGQYVITLTFDPSSVGAQTGKLSFGVETEEGLADIALTGEGVTEGGDGGATSDGGGGDGGGAGDGGGTTPTGMLYSTSSIAFGNVPVGSSDSESVTITNNTGGDVLIRDIRPSSMAILTSGISVPVVMSNGSSQTMQVSFSPTNPVAYNESVAIETDVGNHNITVTGTGEESCAICAPVIDVDTGGSPTEMNFTSLFGIPDEQMVVILNIGDEDLIVRDVHLTNDSLTPDSYFGVSWSGSSTVSPGGSISFEVSYVCPEVVCLDLPNEAFDWNVLHIESNDPSKPDWTIGLNGA